MALQAREGADDGDPEASAGLLRTAFSGLFRPSPERLDAQAGATRALERHDQLVIHCQELYDKLDPTMKERLKYYKSGKRGGTRTAGDGARAARGARARR